MEPLVWQKYIYTENATKRPDIPTSIALFGMILLMISTISNGMTCKTMNPNKAFHPYGAQGAPRVNADVQRPGKYEFFR